MSGLKNSPFGKRLRASQQDTTEEEGHRRNRPRVNPIFGLPLSLSSTPGLTANSATSDSSNGPDSPVDEPPPSPSRGQRKESKREYYGDRFVPSRDAGDMRTSYHLMGDAGPSTPSKSRIIPSESDALKEQANSIFNSILHTEVTPPSPHRPSSPARAPSMVPPTTPTRKRLFAYSSPSSRPTTPNTSRVLDSPSSSAYSMSPVRTESRDLLLSPRRQLRSVCKTPYRVLDAPELADDFYLNLVDWSSTNVLGVGLGSCVYLWTAHNAAVNKLCDLAPQGDTVSSVSWVQHGTSLAIGTLSGRLHIYDASTLGLLRTYQNAHSQRIGALAWNSHILSSGSRDRMVHHRDVRIQDQRPFRKCAGHKQEVCGLKWSGDGSGGSASSGSMGAASANLASGGNDNKVCIWDLRGSRRSGGTSSRSTGSSVSSLNMNTATFNPTSTITPGVLSAGTAVNSNYPTNADEGMSSGDIAPLWKFHEHTAAVKALAWDPHVNGVLATGGGTQDKHIRFWNVGHGTMLSELDTGSQVCNLIWSLTSHELVSTHGFSSTTAQNQICIWKYPTLNMVASLTGHTNRVLYLAMSPDGETIVTGAGDETLRFWNAFPKTSGGRGTSYSTVGREEKPGSQLDYGKLIR
ncbi:hypothetical protein CCMSSC00406_0009436 [Pleurotus cornucopiae]|uniref:Uncharacterized protein n=1 Tax=Pleurotus cornucopiae TaxID=5321 RepID=A0ACB7IUC7_PLECO|nr:hypothetical protein CCMSSC00406_0009436 [Pleurotus cornucopiae]